MVNRPTRLFCSTISEISDSNANGESTPYDKVDTCYSGRGLKAFVSYPYQAQSNASQVCSGLGDSYVYDAFNRPSSIIRSDGSSVTTTYSGADSSVTDEGNGTRSIQRVSQLDALGRLIAACEMTSQTLQFGLTPTPASQCNSLFTGAGFATTYQYDALNNLLSVAQGGLNSRRFNYDSLSHLLTATNPESGTICYGTWTAGYGSTCASGYDADGRLTARTMLAPNQTGTNTVKTTYGYDALGRLLSKTYLDGSTPAAYYNYDETSAFAQSSLTNTIGRLSSEGTSNGSWLNSAVYSYDNMGRPVLAVQDVPTTYSLAYQYNLVGEPTAFGNGVGVTFQSSYNVGGRLTSLTSSLSDSSHPASLVSGITYSPWGGPFGATLGNGVTEVRQYYPRGWLQSLTDTGMIATVGAPGSGAITISGQEGSNSQGSATVTITGSERYQTQPATQSKGTITVTGQETCTSNGNIIGDARCFWDTGSLDVTVNGYDKTVQYGQNSSVTSLALAIATAFTIDLNSPATATSAAGNVYFTSRASGSNTNYQIVGSNNSGTTDFSFKTSPVNMSGGQDAVNIYDAGTVNLTVGSYPASASFDNNTNNTTAKVAAALAASLNGSTIVSASASGAAVTITSRSFGANTNYSLSASSSSSQGFSPPSFGVSTPGSLAGGTGPAGSGKIFDAGTVSVTVNNYQAQVSYGQYSSPTSIASALASAISNSPDVSATSNGTTTTITARQNGTNTDYAVSESVSSGNGFSPPSFSLTSLAALTGGKNNGSSPGTIYSLSLTYALNGDVQSANDLANGSWKYVYDDMNRLITSTCLSGCSASYSYGYDRFGKR